MKIGIYNFCGIREKYASCNMHHWLREGWTPLGKEHCKGKELWKEET